MIQLKSYKQLQSTDCVKTSNRNLVSVTSSRHSRNCAIVINYHGVDIYEAAARGSLPLCVLLWGIASAKKVNIMACDNRGNNPIHFAVLAPTPEVVGFLLQQTKGIYGGYRLIDSRNEDGETPLLRAMRSGVIPVAKVLLDEGSDVFAVDIMGNSVFSVLCQNGHLWELHFIFHYISNTYGVDKARALLTQSDYEGHTCLDWAADRGDVNILEYLLRRGVEFDRKDKLGRSPLYWAVRSNRISAVMFLVRCGCAPLSVDVSDQSPLSLAKADGRRSELMNALKCYDHQVFHLKRTTDEDFIDGHSFIAVAIASGPEYLAVFRRGYSRVGHVLLFGLLMCIVWLLSLVVPFYIWIMSVGFVLFGFRYLKQVYIKQDEDELLVDFNQNNRTYWQDLLTSQEKGLGVWLGSFSVYTVYLVSCLLWAEYRSDKQVSIGGVIAVRLHDPLGLGGVDGEVDDTYLFWSILSLLVLSAITWLRVAWLDTDPGIIDTRSDDMEETLKMSLLVGGCPPQDQYCRTTLVRKPLRSKYCTRTGCVVARMDHYCMWLNITVGHRNHRAFICFLVTHLFLAVFSTVMIARSLHRDIASSLVCDLLSPRFFMVTTLCAFMSITSVGLFLLTAEQLYNVTQNLTINEKINKARYSYLHAGQDRNLNIFNKGIVNNVLEFCGVPGYAVDYYKLFDMPPQLRDTVHSSEVHSDDGNVDNANKRKDDPTLSATAMDSFPRPPHHHQCTDHVHVADVV